jgi:hypothetical protein
MIRRCSLFNSPCSSSNVVFTSFPPLASFAEIGFVRGRPGKWFSACTLLGHGEPLHPGIRPCDGARQRGDPRPARMGSRPAGRLGPWRTALRNELALPSDVVGPRLQRPFRRLGSRLASLIMPAPMASFVPFSFYRDSRLYASKMEPPKLPFRETGCANVAGAPQLCATSGLMHRSKARLLDHLVSCSE